MHQQGKQEQCVSLLSDQWSHLDILIRMTTLYKYLSFSVPHDQQNTPPLPLFPPSSLLARHNPFISCWRQYLSDNLSLFLPCQAFSLFLSFTTVEKGVKHMNYVFPFLPHLHLPTCLFMQLHFCSISTSLPASSCSFTFAPTLRLLYFSFLTVMNTINEQARDRHTQKDGA